MLKKIGIALGVVILIVLGLAALKSPDYLVTRSIVINAPADKIFPFINNQKLAEKWGPWLEIEPGVTMVYSGPDEGIGAKGSWAGGKNLGTGSATIVNVVPNEKVDIKLEYSEPMVMTQDSEYLLTPDGSGGTRMTWTVRGTNSFIGRVMCLFMDMDKVVGSMFEKGLSNLKALVEQPAA